MRIIISLAALLTAILAFMLWWFLGSGQAPGATPSTSQPNILLILADDLGNNDVGSFGDGTIETPNIDALAARGVRFTRHYAHATCRPARVALLTGRPASHSGVPPYFRGIPPEFTTLPEALQAAGYQTHHIGKWHVGRTLPSSQPQQQGFDQWFGFLTALATRTGSIHKPGVTYNNPFLQENDKAPRKRKGHLTELLTNRAVATIEAAAKQQQPWFINLWYFAPHTPIQPAGRFAKGFPDTDEGRFLALVTQLDAAVGKLRKTLKKTGQLDNTLIVFVSDNGGLNKFRDNNAPFAGTKNSFTEGGLRTPLLLNMPGTINAGTVSEPVFISDLMPTLLAVAGASIPDNVEGRDLGPLLRGESVAPVTQYFWDIQKIAEVQYGVLDLQRDVLTNGDSDADAAAAYANWRNAVRATDLQRDSYRRTPGYGAWTLQAILSADASEQATIVQPEQFSITSANNTLAIVLPGHSFSVALPSDDSALLTVSSYYEWSEFKARNSRGYVAVYWDEQEIYKQDFALTEDMLVDNYPALQISKAWSEVIIRNDYLENGLTEAHALSSFH